MHKIFLKDRKRGKDLAQFEIFHRTGLSKLLNNTTIHDLRETFLLPTRFTPLYPALPHYFRSQKTSRLKPPNKQNNTNHYYAI